MSAMPPLHAAITFLQFDEKSYPSLAGGHTLLNCVFGDNCVHPTRYWIGDVLAGACAALTPEGCGPRLPPLSATDSADSATTDTQSRQFRQHAIICAPRCTSRAVASPGQW